MSEAVKTRPPISGSMALKCRMHIFLAAHAYPEEPVQPGTRRTFDVGTLVETAMLRGIPLVVPGENGSLDEITLGPWWKDLGEVRDNKTGKSFTAEMGQLSDFQRTVNFAGYSGHIDALLTLDTGKYVLDTKTTQGFGYDRALTSDLLADVFAREYVGQLHFYMAGLMAEGEDIAGAVLVYFNKEQSAVMARFVDYDLNVVEEIKERLSWAKSDGEPEADWAWVKGTKIPLRCGYCSFRQSCAGVRGLSLLQQFDKKNQPEWIVT